MELVFDVFGTGFNPCQTKISIVFFEGNASEISTHISVSQDGGNLCGAIFVTLDQQSGNKDSGNEIKDGGGERHLGFNLNRRGMQRVLFILRLRLHLRCGRSHVF